MICKIKGVGFVLMAAMAVGAVTASAASAQTVGKLTADGPVTQITSLTGEANQNAIAAFGVEVRCTKAVYTAHKAETTPHERIPVGASTATITPHFGLCTGFGFPTTVDVNGCDALFTFGETSGENKYAVTANVICPAGKHVQATIFASAAKHTAAEPFCVMTITEKTEAYPGLSITDTGNGFLDTSGTVGEISMDQSSPTGSILCPTESTNTATLKIDLTQKGTNAAGETTAMSISH